MSKVLIVDDAVFMRLFIKEILEENGFEIVGEAVNGHEAITKARELTPDLITMDIVMPVLDGISAVRQIVTENPRIKICMLTTMGKRTLVRDAIVAGAKSFITKPFQQDEVIKTLTELIKT